SFCTILLALSSCTTQKTNSQKSIKIKKLPNTSGRFLTNNKSGDPVIIEWMKTNIQAPEFSAAMQEVAPIAVLAYWPIELQFLGEHPESVLQDKYLNQFAPFFEKGAESVDWKAVKNKIQQNLKQIYEMDLSLLGPDVLKPFVND